ncbi:uncharacterized protein LOC144097123 [Amblyomma americanum]
MWNQVVYENTWSPQTRKAIGLQRRCVESSVSRLSRFQLKIVDASTIGLHIAAAAAVGALSSPSSTGPAAADWHTPKAAWSLDKMSDAQFFYLRYAYFRCSVDKDARLFVNEPLKLNTDFATAFGCRASERAPSSPDCANFTQM